MLQHTEERGGQMRGGRGVVLALQNEFSDIFMSLKGVTLKVFTDISANVELCHLQGGVGLKEPTF